MCMAVTLKKAYNTMLDSINEAAAEAGELHLLEELKETIEKVEEQDAGNE